MIFFHTEINVHYVCKLFSFVHIYRATLRTIILRANCDICWPCADLHLPTRPRRWHANLMSVVSIINRHPLYSLYIYTPVVVTKCPGRKKKKEKKRERLCVRETDRVREKLGMIMSRNND